MIYMRRVDDLPALLGAGTPPEWARLLRTTMPGQFLRPADEALNGGVTNRTLTLDHPLFGEGTLWISLNHVALM